MNVLDITILLCFIPGIIAGIKKGFIAQLMGLLSVIIGTFLAYNFYNFVAKLIKPYINGSDALLRTISFGLILILTIFTLMYLGKGLEKVFKVIMMQWLNKLLGGVFAFMKTYLIIGLIILFINYFVNNFAFTLPNIFKESMIYTSLEEVTLNIFPPLKDFFIKQI